MEYALSGEKVNNQQVEAKLRMWNPTLLALLSICFTLIPSAIKSSIEEVLHDV